MSEPTMVFSRLYRKTHSFWVKQGTQIFQNIAPLDIKIEWKKSINGGHKTALSFPHKLSIFILALLFLYRVSDGDPEYL